VTQAAVGSAESSSTEILGGVRRNKTRKKQKEIKNKQKLRKMQVLSFFCSFFFW